MIRSSHLAALRLSLAVAAAAVMASPVNAKPMAGPPLAADMKAVLDELAALGAKPAETLSPPQARAQPSPADAVKSLMAKRHIAMPTDVKMVDTTYPAAAGPQPARVYTSAGAMKNRPLIVYYHGGGWVIADIATYDGGAAGIARQTGAVVVSCEYRHAPENKFPAAHDDATACYKWATANALQWGAGGRVGIAGESAGGNLAIDTAIAARDQGWAKPAALLLVYPVAGSDMTTPSYRDSADAKPLSKGGMMWFVKHTFADPAQGKDPRIDVYKSANLKGLPPTIIINAAADPLRSDGTLLTAALKSAGVTTMHREYPGTAHEFFGMDAVVAQAKAAQMFAGTALKPLLAR